jgi:hypothetical protein
VRGATEVARRTLSFPSDATVSTAKFAALLNFSANAPSLFRIPLHRTVSPTIAHVGDRGSASSRIALPRPSRVDELPMSAHSKYGAKYLDLQCLFWSILDSRKSPVKGCESGMGGHGQESCYLRKSVHAWLLAPAAFRSLMPMRIFSQGSQCALAGNSGLCSCSP